MNDAVLLWILGGLLAAISSIAALLWRHVEHCKDVHSKLAELGADVRHVMQDIGTHDTGLRATVHKTASAVQRIEFQLSLKEHDQR